jgi:hypothetical protein
MKVRLPPGHLYGQNLRARQVAGFFFTEVVYSAGCQVTKHCHELSQFCFVRDGAFSEVYGKKSREVGPLTVIARPSDEAHAARWSAALREKVFNNWPATDPRPAVKVVSDVTHNGVRARLVEFQPDDAYRLQLALLTHTRQTPARLAVRVLDEEQWRQWAAVGGQYFPALFASENNNGAVEAKWLKPLQQGTAIALVMPRGVRPTAWRKEKDTHIRRRFLLLGQSLETMQVWDARAALSALRSLPPLGRLPVSLHGARTMSVVALFAALFEDGVKRLELERPPTTLANGPSFPNVLRFFDLPQLVALALPRTINLTSAESGDWEWSLKVAKLLDGTITF